MKSLRKLRLINWHYFLNTKIDFGTINFLTGENAAGKSTLIDAMQVLLLGDTSGRSFNKAANEKSGRTLKSYLRGEIGDNDDGSTKYLRTGRFTSYIAMEFYDDVNDQPFTVGVVFDMFDDGSEEHKFFYIQDAFLENDFCQLNVPMSQKQLVEYVNQNYSKKEFTFCDSNVQYQNLLKEKFGNLKDKYFSLFKKAVSFTPITNIEQFITDYVCDVPSEINIESMKANISAYERLKLEADDMQIKIRSLEEIGRIYNEIVARRQEQLLASYISKRISCQFHLDKIIDLQNDIKVNESRIEEINEALKEIDIQLASLNREKENLIGLKVSSDSYKFIADLKKTYEDAKRKTEEIETNVSSIYNRLSSYIHNFTSYALKISILCENLLEINYENKELVERIENILLEANKVKHESELLKDALAHNNSITRDEFKHYAKIIAEFKHIISEAYGELKSNLASLITTFTTLKSQINETSSAGKSYDYNFIQVKNQLAHALEDYFHEKVEVSVYADLVDIKTPKWVNAIEGFISSQKLNLFVDSKYYEVANKILPEIMRRNRYYRTGLVDAEKLYEQNFSCNKNSVAEEIITSHQGARDYTNFLLGNIYKCDTFKQARESGRGLCPDCTGYRNFASFVIPENSYHYLLIGRKVSEENLQKRKMEVGVLADFIEQFRSLVDALNQTSRLDVMSTNEIDSSLEVLDLGEMLPTMKRNLETYRKEIEEGASQEVNIADSKIQKINDDIHALEEEKQELTLEKGSLQASSNLIKDEKIPAQLRESSRLQNEIDNEFELEWVEEVGLVTFNQEIETGASLSDIRYKYDEIFTKSQNKMRSFVTIFNELRKEFIVTYKLSFDITKDNNDEFERELINLRDVKLPQYLAKIEDARLKATKEFKDDFIFKLKTSIEQARTQIDELNEALRDAVFGQDSYQFTVLPNPQYIDYYNMITDELLLEVGSDEDAFLEKHQTIMDNLFRLIGDGGDGNNQSNIIAQNIEKFTDYRTYLVFDLKVRKPDGRIYSLARNIKKASGGETQTPFYISILASFSQLYRVKASKNLSNCTRLVVFDEAFSKMDRNRIIEAVRILKQFDLQVILSAPPEKVSDISKIVDKTLIVTRHNNRSFIDPYVMKKGDK